MSKLLGNNCAKGCMIYFVALVAVVVLTSMGIGGLGARFGANSKTQISPLNVPGAQQPLQPVATPNATGVASSQSAVQAAPLQPTSTPAIAPSTAGGTQQATGGQAQGGMMGTISGETIQPFYIVQDGDTLWGIARDYGIAVDALRGANNAAGDIIKPGDLVYLPQGGQATAPQPVQPAPQSQPSNTQPGESLPSMPQTGINKEP